MSPGKPELVDLLRTMILIREFDLLAIELRKSRRIYGALHPYVGEEAVAVGACSALRATDRITSTHRGHGLFAHIGMERSVNPAILPQLDREEIELADQDHRAEQVDQFRLSR